MSSIIDTLTDYTEALRGIGLRVTMDPRNVNPPCVLMVPPSFTVDVVCGGTAAFTAYFLVPPPGNLDAWAKLDQMAADASEVLPIETLLPSQYEVDATGMLPAFEAAWTQSIQWP